MVSVTKGMAATPPPRRATHLARLLNELDAASPARPRSSLRRLPASPQRRPSSPVVGPPRSPSSSRVLPPAPPLPPSVPVVPERALSGGSAASRIPVDPAVHVAPEVLVPVALCVALLLACIFVANAIVRGRSASDHGRDDDVREEIAARLKRMRAEARVGP
jgi:hypothetical protein